MLQRIFSFIGFYPQLPSLPSSAVMSPEIQGQTRISFTPGSKAALSAADDEDERDERRERITDQDLVWPGKTDTLNFQNDNDVSYRFDMTLPGLDPSFYVRRPPIGGAWQPEGGVLLKPGEETAFEVVYVQPPDTMRAKPKIFSYTITGYDPRRSNDPGDIVGDAPMRWVPIPTGKDLQLSAKPDQVIIRPWRRAALFQLELLNKSYLPPSIELRILRAPKKEELGSEAEAVGTVGQALESRTSGVWYCLLPAAAKRGSYFATVAGTAKVADNVEFAVSLPEPVLVKYVPWLSVPKDWAFLVGSVLFLFWLIWGIPVYKEPVVHMALGFPGVTKGNSLPPGAQAADFKVMLQPLSGEQPDGEAIQGEKEKDNPLTYKFTLPGYWYGNRWPFGWNGWSSDPTRFKLAAIMTNQDAQKSYLGYDLNTINDVKSNDVHFQLAANDRPFFGEWTVNRAASVSTTQGIFLRLMVDDLGAAKAAGAKEIVVTCRYQGEVKVDKRTYPLPTTLPGVLDERLPLGGRTSGLVDVIATVGPVSSHPFSQNMDPLARAQEVHLQFPVTAVAPGAPTKAVAGQPVTIPVIGGDTKAKVLVNDKPAAGGKVTATAVTAPIPKTAQGTVTVATQSPGKPKDVLATLRVSQPQEPPKSPVELAHLALLKNNVDDAEAQAAKIDGTDPAKFAVLVYVEGRRASRFDTPNAAKHTEQQQANMAQLLMFKGNAKTPLEKALTLSAQAYVLDVKNQFDQAVPLYRQGLAADPNCVLVRCALAQALGNPPPDGLGRREEAKQVLAEGLKGGHVDAASKDFFNSIYSKFAGN